MIFRQFTHDDLGCASYIVGDEDAGVAVDGGVGTWERAGHPIERGAAG